MASQSLMKNEKVDQPTLAVDVRVDSSRSVGEINDLPSASLPLSIISSHFSDNSPEDMADSSSSDSDSDESISDSDADSIIEVSMGRAASLIKSPKTPIIEKQKALAAAGGLSKSSPGPRLMIDTTLTELDESDISSGTPSPPHRLPYQIYKQTKGLSLGSTPSGDRKKSITAILPKDFESEPHVTPPSSPSLVNRAISGSAAALKKILPSTLPSLATFGNFFLSGSQASDSPSPRDDRSGKSSSSGGTPIGGLTPRTQSFETSLAVSQPPHLPRPPATIRRATSDDSLLYHSLSNTSSLGDDTRFEDHRQQANSRVRAIRDSLKHRSSFRLPDLPNLPKSLRDGGPDTDNFADVFLDIVTNATSDSTPNDVKEAAQTTAEESRTFFLDQALESLEGDIVIMGGYRGSILRSTETTRKVWIPIKVGLNLRKVDLEVGLEPEDEDQMEDSIYPSGMLQKIGPVDISKRLFKRLRKCENARNNKLRVWDYGYDWRLSPHLLSKKLTAFLEKLPSNQPGSDGTIPETGGALVIAHSLGGLITRHVVNQRPELFAGVVYAGVPQSCVNILGPIRNGDEVMLNSKVLTAQVNFTLRTSFLLLPEDGGCFVDMNTEEEYPVDFFDLDDWIKYRFSPCVDPPLPPRNPDVCSLSCVLDLPETFLSLPSLVRKSISGSASPQLSPLSSNEEKSDEHSLRFKTVHAIEVIRDLDHVQDRTIDLQMGHNSSSVDRGHSSNTSISREKAISYLQRTLAETKKFKQELYFQPEKSASNRYPPLAVIYGKSIPTCCGAKVDGREGIPCSDSYDNLVFASGDGVCLAKETMLPKGYKTALGGRIRSHHGHATLLGDLNAVGRAISAVSMGRSKGIGLGLEVSGTSCK